LGIHTLNNNLEVSTQVSDIDKGGQFQNNN